MMKRLMMLIPLLFAAVGAFAGDCVICNDYGTACLVRDASYASATCLAGQTDCSDPSQYGPCAVHCNLSGWCSPTRGGQDCPQDYYMVEGVCTWGGDTTPPPGDLSDCLEQSCSPIVINLGTGSYAFSSTSDPVTFDLIGTGKITTTWTARGSNVAFLVFDRNHNGVIDDGSELFGTWGIKQIVGSKLDWNGFEKLKWWDSNGNGVIDEFDRIWPYLRLWIDRNHDGISQPDELLTLESQGITMLDLDYHATRRQDEYGNHLRFMALLTRNGHREPYYDVYFQSAK